MAKNLNKIFLLSTVMLMTAGFSLPSFAQSGAKQIPLSMQMPKPVVKSIPAKKINAEDDDAFSQAEKNLEDLEAVVDTGVEMNKDKYTFGAQQKLDEDTRVSFGVGAKMNNSADYNMSSTHRNEGSQTNNIEENFNPLNASPMVGVELGYKF